MCVVCVCLQNLDHFNLGQNQSINIRITTPYLVKTADYHFMNTTDATKFKQSSAFPAGNMLKGDVSDVIALDQPKSLFSPRKVTRMSP